MADLAKRELPRRVVRRGSDNQDFLLPSRRETRSPGIEVNAPLVGPNQSRATALLDILEVGAKAGQQGVDYLEEKAAEKRQQDRASGAAADQLGKADAEQLKKSRAYAQGYYLSGAHRTLIDLETATKQAVQARLNDTTQPPATPEDIHNLINDHFASVSLNEDGTVRNFGDPLAAQAMVNGLSKIREEIVPDALATIKDQTDDKLIGNLMYNLAHGVGLKELGHEEAPAGLTLSGDGVPKPGAIQSIDPNTAIGNKAAATVAAKPLKLTTGRLPIQGTITSSYKAHEARGSHGLDIDGYKGQPVEAPAAGKVVKSGYDARSGNYIIIDHGNGITSSYAHLSSRYFKVGQVIQAGDTLGAIGNTGHVVASGGGDGSHLHYRVKVHGKDVDPQTFKFDGVTVPEGQAANLAPAQVATPVTPVAYDFEAVMAQKPPSMDPKTFKTKAIDALIIHADEAKRPDILEGMAMSRRKDGTPSFSPEEILKLRDSADTLRNKHYREAQLAERQLHEANEDKVLRAFTLGNDPSIADIQNLVRQGQISDRFGYTMVNTIEADQHRDEVEAHAIAREAQADADRETDEFVTAEAIRRQYGDFTGPDPLDLFNKGQLGSGKSAFRRLAQLRQANKAGADYLSKTPSGATALNLIDQAFPASTPGGANSFAAITGQGVANARQRAGALAAFDEKVQGGMKPVDAAKQVLKEWAPTSNEEATLRAQAEALRAKAAK